MSRILDERDKQKLDSSISNINKKIVNLEEDTAEDIENLKSNLTTQIKTVNSNVTSLESDLTVQINDLEDSKVDKDGDKVLSENDLTDSLKDNYDAAYSHSIVDHAPVDAEMNVQPDWIETDVLSDSYIKNKPTTLAGYGITDAQSKITETNKLPVDLVDINLYMRVLEGYIQYSFDNATWTNLITTAEIVQSGSESPSET